MVNPVRSKIMRSIRSKDTSPELFVRRLVHGLGFRFRLHYAKLPGRPDLALPKYRAIILVNGCFWHGHNCHIYNPSKRRPPEWEKKISRNRERDESNLGKYRELGWRYLIVWECAIQGKTKWTPSDIAATISDWLNGDSLSAEIRGISDS